MELPRIYLVSACLLGLPTRYDGESRSCAECRGHLPGGLIIPFCPEQLGGLPTPRPAADLVGGNGHDVLAGRARVVTRQGEDVSRFFIRGAEQVLVIAGLQPVHSVFMKARSPSCGLTPRTGVTAALLLTHGYMIREF